MIPKTFGPFSMTQLGALQKPDKLILDYRLKTLGEVPTATVTGTTSSGCTVTIVEATDLKSCTGWVSHVFDLKQQDILSIILQIDNYERFKNFKEATLTFKTTGVVQETRIT